MPPQDQRPASWEDIIRFEAKQAKVPPQLAIEISRAESNFNPTAISPKGARGLFQLMPDTAKEMGVDPDDPVQNIRGGVRYFRQQLDKYQGDVGKALQAYNWGPANVDQGGQPPPETQQYVQRVLGGLKAPTAQGQALGIVPVNVGTPPPTGPRPSKYETATTEKFREPPTWGETAADIGASVLGAVDPRERTGRRNLMGAAGAALAIPAATAVGVPAGLGLGTAAVLGAMTGGGAQEVWESLVGTPPPEGASPSLVGRMGEAATEQGMYEMGGQVFMWPFKALGRRLISSSVGRQASESLTRARRAINTQFADTLATAQTALRQSKRFASQAAEAGTSRIEARYARAGHDPGIVALPSPSAAGQQAKAVVKGPAQTARDEVGQMVEDAAKTGPDVDIKALKDEARRIFGEEIRPSQMAFPSKPPGDVPGTAGINIQNLPHGPQADALKAAMAQAEEEQVQATMKHPALGVLGRILNAEDTVPFAATHGFKMELDQALKTRGAWDKGVHDRVTGMTMKLRSVLRESLRGHAPYDQATAAYNAIAPLYTQGLAPKLRKAAIDDPGVAVHQLSPRFPEKARLLRDLLVTQGAAGGGAAEGQAAWDSIRAAWTHDKIMKKVKLGGIEDYFNKLDPDFAGVVYGDQTGSAIKQNLLDIDRAYKAAEQRGQDLVAQTAERGLQGQEMLRQTHRVEAGKIATERDALSASRLGAPPPGGGFLPWKWSLTRRLLHGPRSSELLRWAAYSTANTQRVVRALTSPVPGMAVADVIRLSGLGSILSEVVGIPPPERSRPAGTSAGIGSPPPG